MPAVTVGCYEAIHARSGGESKRVRKNRRGRKDPKRKNEGRKEHKEPGKKREQAGEEWPKMAREYPGALVRQHPMSRSDRL